MNADGGAPRPAAPNLVSTQLLVDLVTNTLDPGYAAAAKRRGGQPSRRWYDGAAVAVGCMLIGFLLVVAYVHTHRGAPEAAKVQDSLVTRVRAAQKDDARLAEQVDKLTAELAAVRDRALPAALADRVERGQIAAGQTEVHGPGLTVVLKEPPPATPTAEAGQRGATPITATNILSDRDVRSVVNELWADGAEAIAVNDVRISPTSAIRFAGQAILVDFQPISSPYTIEAIGSADDLAVAFASSAVASRYQTLAGADGIGFSFSESKDLTLPASSSVSLRYARAAATASSSNNRTEPAPSSSPAPPGASSVTTGSTR